MPSMIDLVRSVFPDREISEDSDLIAGGLIDSFDVVILVTAIEEHLKVSIPGDQVKPENFQNVPAIQALANACARNSDMTNAN